MALQKITQFFSPSFLTESPLTKTLGEEFVLCENGNMVFHWADFFETCDHIKKQLENDEALMQDFKKRAHALKRLDLIPVWIKTESKIHQTTMFELYERYILNQSHLTGIDPFCPLQISFISGTGPFKEMSVADCFNKSTYKDFVLVYLIEGKLPRRDFRIRLKSKILMEHGENFREAELVSLEQMTMNGLLLSLDSETYMKKISNLEQIRILMNFKILEDARGKGLEELQLHLSQYAFNLLYSANKNDALTCDLKELYVQSSFDFSRNKKVYLFVSYDKLAKYHPNSVKIIKDFVEQTKTLVKEHYTGPNISKTA